MSFEGTFTRRRLRAASAGFTLAEVVVAVLIFGLSAAVLGQAVSDSLRAYALSRQEADAAHVGETVRRHVLTLLTREEVEKGGELEVPIAQRKEGSEEVRTEMAKVRWEAEVLPSRLINVFQLKLTAHQQSGSQVMAIERPYIVYRPSWSEDDEVDQLREAKEQEFAERLGERGILPEEEAGE